MAWGFLFEVNRLERKNENETTTRNYYDSSDADIFYTTVWGQEHIHQGIFNAEDEPMQKACLRTVKTMAERLGSIGNETEVADIGSGYGGTARYLASHYGCHVNSLNLSKVQNEHSRRLNKKRGLEKKIDIVAGSFEDMPFESSSIDVCWSIDALLHSANKQKVMEEVYRILKPGGEFVFADPMRTEGCPKEILRPILERIHLSDMGSVEFYEAMSSKLKFEYLGFTDYSASLIATYSRALKYTVEHEDELSEKVSLEFINHMKEGLNHWVNGGKNGYLQWGIFHLRKKI